MYEQSRRLCEGFDGFWGKVSWQSTCRGLIVAWRCCPEGGLSAFGGRRSAAFDVARNRIESGALIHRSLDSYWSFTNIQTPICYYTHVTHVIRIANYTDPKQPPTVLCVMATIANLYTFRYAALPFLFSLSVGDGII